MKNIVLVHPKHEAIWPFTATHFHELWKKKAEVQLVRVKEDESRMAHEVLPNPKEVQKLAIFGVPFTAECLKFLPNLKEMSVISGSAIYPSDELKAEVKKAGVAFHFHTSEAYWGQSVAEFALALTLCGLRRIPQTHHEMITSLKPWDYTPRLNVPGARIYGDDDRFINGTIEGKKVRIVGAGNISSRYAKFVQMLGADVAVWDPFASEPCFHLAGARREHYFDALFPDADIFAPMLPLNDKTRGMISEKHINALPKGCLVVLASRAPICDMQVLRKRVMADELSLAADVFEVEPLPLDDPLLGRHNVVHTPHNAGKTKQANEQLAEMLVIQFSPG